MHCLWTFSNLYSTAKVINKSPPPSKRAKERKKSLESARKAICLVDCGVSGSGSVGSIEQSNNRHYRQPLLVSPPATRYDDKTNPEESGASLYPFCTAPAVQKKVTDARMNKQIGLTHKQRSTPMNPMVHIHKTSVPISLYISWNQTTERATALPNTTHVSTKERRIRSKLNLYRKNNGSRLRCTNCASSFPLFPFAP